MSVLFGKPPKMQRDVTRVPLRPAALDLSAVSFEDAVQRVLRLPTVAGKQFLITIGDRTVTGMVHRDQMVGPWQVPVADCAVTTVSYDSRLGEAMAMGERTPLALLDGPASARMAIAEALTNIAAAGISRLQDVRLSANWMCAAGQGREDEVLYDTVRAAGMEFCPALGITIPVGKDSMSMRTAWTEGGEDKSVTAPTSLIVSAFAPVQDVTRSVTPQLQSPELPSNLILVDLGGGRNRLGGSCLAQVYGQVGSEPPDIDDPVRLRALCQLTAELLENNLALAYHDRSDGGLLACVLEMACAGHCGLELDVATLGEDAIAALFAEETGAVYQVESTSLDTVMAMVDRLGLADCTHLIGQPVAGAGVKITRGAATLFEAQRDALQSTWMETSYRIQSLRDNPACALQEFEQIRMDDPGLSVSLSFDQEDDIAAPFIQSGARPRVAVLREQGVNGHVEMAAAFDRAGFAAVDVHMSDLFSGRQHLSGFQGLVACGGFSYGDVLGAGEGWAKSILFSAALREQFTEFFERPDSFSLGVCNGCQMLSNLADLIPGAGHWPRFLRNRSEQFEARYSLVRIEESRSVLLEGMAGSHLPIAVAHGEGRVAFADSQQQAALESGGNISLRFIANDLAVTERYPANPNGSPAGITGLCSDDGRATIMMPHPERVFRAVQCSWAPPEWKEDGGWMRLFRNARAWVG